MVYRLYNTAQGEFAICFDTCCQIIKSYYRAVYQIKYCTTVTESKTSLLSPSSWGLPDLTYVEVDWARVRQESASDSLSAAFRLGAITMFSTGGVNSLVRELKRMQLETRRLNGLFGDRMREASTKSWSEMEKSISTFQSLIDGAKLVRDLAGSILIAASTAATGGLTAAAGAGAGTALKTYGKFQDTGSYGSAAIEAAQNIAFSVFPAVRGVGLSGGEKVVKVVVSTGADTAKAMLEGRSLATAVAQGAVNIPVALLGEASNRVLQPVLAKTAVPVLSKVMTSAPKIVAKLPAAIAKKVIEDRAKKWGQTAVKTYVGQASLPSMLLDGRRAAAEQNSLADSLSFEDDLLLKFAIVDMSQGIGRSWW